MLHGRKNHAHSMHGRGRLVHISCMVHTHPCRFHVQNFQQEKDMTQNLYRPWGSSSPEVGLYSDLPVAGSYISRVVKNFDLPSWLSILRKGKGPILVTTFSWQQSTQNMWEPSFFFAITTRLACGLLDGQTNPASCICLNSHMPLPGPLPGALQMALDRLIASLDGYHQYPSSSWT